MKKTIINKKYTHFIYNKKTFVIHDGYDYKGLDNDDIKYYFKIDIKDLELDPKEYSIASAKYLLSKGVNPYDSDNWFKYNTIGKTKNIKTMPVKKAVRKKAVAKKTTTRKKAVAKKPVNISYDNSWGKYLDSQKQALPPGRRISKKTGVPYTENRRNHSDVKQTKKKGQMLGIEVLKQKPKPEIVTLARKIATSTHYNDHTNAVLLLAKFLNKKEEITILECISKINGYVGGGALRELTNLRSEILEDLLNIATKKYNLASSELLKSSF